MASDPVYHTRSERQGIFFVFFLVVVSWSPGRLVSWSPGLLVSWSPGLLVSWSPGLLVAWSPGRLVSWSPGLLVGFVSFRHKIFSESSLFAIARGKPLESILSVF